MDSQLKRLHIKGFRSLRDLTLTLGARTVLIGPNGAGKSNLLSVLQLVPLIRTQTLRRFVGQQGASAVLHYGPGVTREIELRLEFESDRGTNCWAARLGYAAGDSLIFLDEQVEFADPAEQAPFQQSLGAGHAESQLGDAARDPRAKTAWVVHRLLSQMSFFHFHDTSATAPLRQNARRTDDRFLRSDGSNLAAFLYRLQSASEPDSQASWRLIQQLTRRIAPYIKRLEPTLVSPDDANSAVRLQWVDEREHLFDVHDLSDGTLRALALITALGQPADSLPRFISIDEPELGLHPAALSLVASLARSVSARAQVVLSTQSTALLDEFQPEDVVVVDRADGASTFRRLDEDALAHWLEDFSLAELYDKNLLGGRP